MPVNTRRCEILNRQPDYLGGCQPVVKRDMYTGAIILENYMVSAMTSSSELLLLTYMPEQ